MLIIPAPSAHNFIFKPDVLPSVTVSAPRRAGDIDSNYADASKALKELGWKAELGIDVM